MQKTLEKLRLLNKIACGSPPTRLVSARFGTFRLESAQLGSDRLGEARPCRPCRSCRPMSAPVGPCRPCWPMSALKASHRAPLDSRPIWQQPIYIYVYTNIHFLRKVSFRVSQMALFLRKVSFRVSQMALFWKYLQKRTRRANIAQNASASRTQRTQG